MIADEKVIALRALLKYGTTLRDAARVSEMSVRTARKYVRLGKLPSEYYTGHKWRTRSDPFAQVWPEIESQLQKDPNLSAVAVFGILELEHPGSFSNGQMRTLQRKLADRKKVRPKASLQCRLGRNCNDEQVGHWMTQIMIGKYCTEQVSVEVGDDVPVSLLVGYIRSGKTKERNKALTVLARYRGFTNTAISRFLHLSARTTKRYFATFSEHGPSSLFSTAKNTTKKKDDPMYIQAVSSLLHSPPSSHGINRTTWKQDDLHRILAKRGFPIARQNIRAIIRKQGFNWRKAKKVLTSHDPEYKAKVERITSILSNIGVKERFFSVDEYGPFHITIKGGRKLIGPGENYTIPQWPKSKGCFIVTGALELCTNQVTHFFSKKKNTEEMIRLLDMLLTEYASMDTLYLSWDAASWHLSKRFQQRVSVVNAMCEEHSGTPRIELAPLPASAQFLNVIESVYSGMARAIVHNSDYQSEEEAMHAIDTYFEERNAAFRANPKRAGKKIWGQERVKPEFSESNNCKDPKYR